MKLLFALTLVLASPLAAITVKAGGAIAKSPGCDPEIHVCSSSTAQDYM